MTFRKGGDGFGLDCYGHHDVILKIPTDWSIDENRKAKCLRTMSERQALPRSTQQRENTHFEMVFGADA